MAAYDTIIVGAGPAGSTAARLLARQGAKVLLLDRARFPRDKPCGGGVTVHAARETDVDLTPVIERTITEARTSFRLGSSFTRVSDEPLTYMTQRCRLDAYLAEQAAAAGTEFRDGTGVREIEYRAHGRAPLRSNEVTVRCGMDTYRGRTLIGADGANGITAGASGLARQDRRAAVALEGNIAADGALAAVWEHAIALDVGGIPGGYGWLFPKGDHLNVGVGGWRYVGPALRQRISDLCGYLGLDASKLEHLRGHHLPLRDRGAPIARGPVLLVGDAAGLVDPLSGEGIRAAFVSARLASETVRRYLAGDVEDLSDYEAAVERELMGDIEVSYKLQALFHRWPRPCVAVMRRSDLFWRTLCRIVRGETSYSRFRSRLGPLRVVFDGAARLAGDASRQG